MTPEERAIFVLKMDKVKKRRDGELALVKQCEEKGVGILHTAAVAQQNANILDWVIKEIEPNQE